MAFVLLLAIACSPVARAAVLTTKLMDGYIDLAVNDTSQHRIDFIKASMRASDLNPDEAALLTTVLFEAGKGPKPTDEEERAFKLMYNAGLGREAPPQTQSWR